MTQPPDPNNSDMLTSVSRDALADLLIHGDNTPKNIADNTGRHRKNISERLIDLEEEGFVINKGGGVYTLTQEGLVMARAVVRDRTETDVGSQ